jgi:hypothetical protein
MFWWNTMAGGVAAHWGRHHSLSKSPYPKPEQLATHAAFWANRFSLDLKPNDKISDGWAMVNDAKNKYVFYREDAASIRMKLSGMAGVGQAFAVDTRKAYAEINIGELKPGEVNWKAPYKSDWAIVVTSSGQSNVSDRLFLPVITAGH